MKTWHLLTLGLIAFLGILLSRSRAVERVIPSVSGVDLVLRWPSATGEVYVVLWTDELSTNTVWTAFVTNHPAATGTNETTYTHTGALEDNTGGMMLLSGGLGEEKLAVQESVVKAQATNVWKSAPLPYWVNILKEYKMPEPPWDEKEQEHLWKTYPSIMPEPPWDKWDHQYVEWVHQWNLHSMKIIEEGPAEPALQLMGLLEGVPQRGFYRVLERNEDGDADGLPDWIEYIEFGTTTRYTAVTAPDADGDGLADALEIHIVGTNPQNADTDGDGLSDGYEHYSSQTDPLVPNSPPTLQSVVIPFCAIP
jgi:hypothetical protein